MFVAVLVFLLRIKTDTEIDKKSRSHKTLQNSEQIQNPTKTKTLISCLIKNLIVEHGLWKCGKEFRRAYKT